MKKCKIRGEGIDEKWGKWWRGYSGSGIGQ